VTGRRSSPFVAVGLGLALLLACQALPSGVPLANSGGVLDDTGTDRDRRPRVLSETVEVGSNDARSAPTGSPHAAAPASGDPLRDAGAPDGAVAEGDAGGLAIPWSGEYFGSDKLVRHFDGESDDVELDDKAHTRVEERNGGALVISIVNSATGDIICALHATAHGAQASLDAGQSCFGDDGSTATVTSGQASVSGDRLVLDFEGKVVENEDEDEDDDPVEFRLDYHFDGRRR
jgi:hypothetical protein